MTAPVKTPYRSLRLAMAAFWGVVCLCIFGAPVLASHAHFGSSSILYLAFSGLCHQISERSFAIAGFPLAVCHRCLGIYLGLLAGTLIKNPFIYGSPEVRRISVLVAVLPLVIDGILSISGVVSGFPESRFLTGFLFGIMLSTLLIYGIMELLVKRSLQKRFHCSGDIK